MLWTVLLAVVACLVLADVLLHVCAVRMVLPQFERKIPFGVELTPPSENAEPIEFQTMDGLTLRGSLWKNDTQNPRGLVLFFPELGGNHWSAGTYAASLIESGFTVLAFDFRNQGESDSLAGYDPLHWLTEYEVADAFSALKYIQSREDLRDLPLGFFGISRGGAAALATATRCRDVRALACEGAYSTESLLLHYTLRWASLYLPSWLMRSLPLWHVRLTLRFARIVSGWRRGCRYVEFESSLPQLQSMPVLMMAGSRDTYVVPQITERLCRLAGSGFAPLQVFEGAKHNQSRQVDSAAYDALLLSLFSSLETGSPQNRESSGPLLSVA